MGSQQRPQNITPSVLLVGGAGEGFAVGAVLCIAGWSQNTLGSWKITLHENSCSRAVPLELSQMIAKYSIPPVCHRNHHMGLLRASNVASVAEERNFYFFFFFLVFLGLHPWHIEVPRLGVKSEL